MIDSFFFILDVFYSSWTSLDFSVSLKWVGTVMDYLEQKEHSFMIILTFLSGQNINVIREKKSFIITLFAGYEIFGCFIVLNTFEYCMKFKRSLFMFVFGKAGL